MSFNSRKIGGIYETQVIETIAQAGFTIITRNYSVYGLGEIDLIFTKCSTILFVEVRSKRNNKFGTPEESVTQYKKFKIYQVASHFIYFHKKYSAYTKKFILVSYSKINDKYKIRFYEF